MLGVSQSRGLKLFGREIIFQKFQPMLADCSKGGVQRDAEGAVSGR